MKKFILTVCAIVALGVLSMFFCGSRFGKAGVNQFFGLTEVEALAACEVSSNASENVGYCSPILRGNGDACVQLGAPESVRCSGNL